MKILRRLWLSWMSRGFLLSLGTGDEDVARLVRGDVRFLSLTLQVYLQLRGNRSELERLELLRAFDGALRMGVKRKGRDEVIPRDWSPIAKETWVAHQLAEALQMVSLQSDVAWFRARLVSLELASA